MPPVLGEAGGLGFHVMDDCIALAQRLTATKRVAIVGAGLVAMELAAALTARGHEVTVIAPRERILRSSFRRGKPAHHRSLYGFRSPLNMRWGEAAKQKRLAQQTRVRFAGGNEIETDVLLACLGVKPRTAFLQGSGVGVDDGIVVDRRMRTNVPNIFAAGDVAEAYDFFSGRNRINPILPSAAAQGKVAGNSMADKTCEYEGSLPMNAFNFFDHLASSIGKVAAAGADEVVSTKRNGSYARLVFHGDTLIGASFLDVEVEAGVIQYLIRKKVRIGKYREMLLQTPREVGFWLMNEAEKGETVSKEE